MGYNAGRGFISSPFIMHEGERMIKFYDVDKNYINFLRRIDRQIPDLEYDSHDKFVCGIVLNIGEVNYYAPISHFNIPQKTNFPIYDKGRVISTVRFCFMFPADSIVLSEKNFNKIAQIDQNYANLLNTEYEYCKNNLNELLKRANSVYKIGCNKNHFLNYTCCDFKKLENEYIKYDRTKTYPKA